MSKNSHSMISTSYIVLSAPQIRVTCIHSYSCVRSAACQLSCVILIDCRCWIYFFRTENNLDTWKITLAEVWIPKSKPSVLQIVYRWTISSRHWLDVYWSLEYSAVMLPWAKQAQRCVWRTLCTKAVKKDHLWIVSFPLNCLFNKVKPDKI